MTQNKLKFGIQNGLNVARAGYNEDQILTACMLADKTGYDSIFYMDHTNVPQWKNATVLDPWVMLSAIAAVTNNVELGTCVTDAIRRHPSNIALAAITLDRVSKGRAILGIGAGEAQNLKEFCIPFEKPVSKWAEQIEVIKTLYASTPDNTVNYDGKYYQLEGACLQAAPIRKPHPPTYMAAGGKRTLELTGKLGDGWLPIGYTPELFEDHRQQIEVSMDKHNRTQEEKDNFQMALDIDVYFSEDAEESWAKMKEAVKVSLFKPEVLRVHGLKEIEGFDFVKYFTEYSMSDQSWIVKMREAATKIPDGIARSSTAVGTPDDIIPTFERFMKAGVNHFVIRFWGKNYFGSIDKFASHVMPHLREKLNNKAFSQIIYRKSFTLPHRMVNMKENLPETLEECFKILEENVNILTQLEMDLEDKKEDELVPNMDLHNLIDMTEDVSESSKIKRAEFNLIRRQAEDTLP